MMPKVLRVLFSGSRFVFWGLVPILSLFAIFMPLAVDRSSTIPGMIVAWLEILAILMLIALYNPRRFRWAGRSVCAFVFLTYAAYLADEIHEGKHSTLDLSRDSPVSALFGFLVIGGPFLWFAISGRFGRDLPASYSPSDPCPHCEVPVGEHAWAMFASIIADEKNHLRSEDFLSLAVHHHWVSLRAVREFKGSQNVLLAYVLRCKTGGALFVWWDPYELWEPSMLQLVQNI